MTQASPANVGGSAISFEQFEHLCKEMATRLSDGSPNPSFSFAPYTPGVKEQGGDKKWSPEEPVSDPETLKVNLRTMMASSGLEVHELMEMVKGVSPTTVAAPPVPRDAPKMPSAPQTQAVETPLSETHFPLWDPLLHLLK